MHITCLKANPCRYWLYVGQTVEAYRRIIREHQNAIHREKYPSLHYSIFNLNIMNDAYVALTVRATVSAEHAATFLNLQEMWVALVFQTLGSKDLKEWLPPGAHCPCPRQHLNVALPLYQRVSEFDPAQNKECFDALQYPGDPFQRQYFWQVLRAYLALRESSDPYIRAAYHRQQRDTHSPGMIVRLKKIAEGLELAVKARGRGDHIALQDYQVNIPEAFGCQVRDTVSIRCQLLSEDERHPKCHTRLAKDIDQAKRLALKLL